VDTVKTTNGLIAYVRSYKDLELRQSFISNLYVKTASLMGSMTDTYSDTNLLAAVRAVGERLSSEIHGNILYDLVSIPTCMRQSVLNARQMFNDYTETNRIVQGRQISDRAFVQFLKMALSDFNIQPPISLNYKSFCDFPSPQILVYGAMVHALEALILTDIRNTAQFNAGGMSALEFGKSPQYEEVVSQLKQQYLQQLHDIKISMNISLAHGGIPSLAAYWGWGIWREI